MNCSAGPVLTRTGELKSIKIKRTNHRPQKKELEFVFELVAAGDTTKVADSKKKAPEKTAVVAPSPKDNDNVIVISSSILDGVFDELKKQGIDLQGKEQLVKSKLQPRVETKLTILKNTAYSHGFSCKPHNLQTKMM